jgi:hypothetical protein
MIKIKAYSTVIFVTIVLFMFTACSETPTTSGIQISEDTTTPTPHSTGQIYLYGMANGDNNEHDKAFEAWNDYYKNDNMRHLFIDSSYYYAQYLNEWINSSTDELLDELYKDKEYKTDIQEFFKRIKNECPETIFHGTNVGIDYNTLGAQYIKHLEDSMLEGFENYTLAKEAIEQGKTFYNDGSPDWAYRENMLAENFIREFDKLNGESVWDLQYSYKQV